MRRPHVPATPSGPPHPHPGSPLPGPCRVGPRSPVPAPVRPRPAPPSPHCSGQTRPPEPELQEPPPRAGARPLGAAPPRGLHRPPCRTRPDRGSPPAAAAAPRPGAPRGLWLCPGAERAGRGTGRTAAPREQDSANARGEVGCRVWGASSWARRAARIQTAWSKLDSPGSRGQATRRVASRPGSRTAPPEVGRKLGKVGKSPRSALCSSPYFSRGLIVSSTARQGALFLVRGPLSHPLLLFGAVAQRTAVAPIPCLLEKFPRSPPRPLGPSRSPRAPAPPPLSLPAPHTSASNFASGVLPAPPSSVPPASPFLSPPPAAPP